eukprot:13909094-Alexandrium_andersonii.AAC.1
MPLASLVCYRAWHSLAVNDRSAVCVRSLLEEAPVAAEAAEPLWALGADMDESVPRGSGLDQLATFSLLGGVGVLCDALRAWVQNQRQGASSSSALECNGDFFIGMMRWADNLEQGLTVQVRTAGVRSIKAQAMLLAMHMTYKIREDCNLA